MRSTTYRKNSPSCEFPGAQTLAQVLINCISYRKVLAQILAPLDGRSVEHVKCVLGWLAFTRRPLRKRELLSAVSFSSGNPDVERPAPEYILNVCGPLIEERSDVTITFIHVSVQE